VHPVCHDKLDRSRGICVVARRGRQQTLHLDRHACFHRLTVSPGPHLDPTNQPGRSTLDCSVALTAVASKMPQTRLQSSRRLNDNRSRPGHSVYLKQSTLLSRFPPHGLQTPPSAPHDGSTVGIPSVKEIKSFRCASGRIRAAIPALYGPVARPPLWLDNIVEE
jgi:hypothetical protein